MVAPGLLLGWAPATLAPGQPLPPCLSRPAKSNSLVAICAFGIRQLPRRERGRGFSNAPADFFCAFKHSLKTTPADFFRGFFFTVKFASRAGVVHKKIRGKIRGRNPRHTFGHAVRSEF